MALTNSLLQPQISQPVTIYICIVNGERFAGLNFCGLHPMKFSWENFCGALGLKHLNNAVLQSLYNIHEKLS